MKLADFVHSNKLKKREFNARLPALRAELLEAQNSLRKADFPVILLFAGVDGAGKSEVVNLLNEWMDPRWLINRAYGRPTDSDSETQRPAFRKYWHDVPPRGRIGLFLSAWYSKVLLGSVAQRVQPDDFQNHVQEIRRFERMHANDGALILKFWMHLDKRHQRKQLERLEANPATSWRVTHSDWAHWAMYNRFVQAGDQIIEATDTKLAPWRVIDGADHRYRSITIAEHLLEAIKNRLAESKTKSKPQTTSPQTSTTKSPVPAKPAPAKKEFKPSHVNWLSGVDLKQTLAKKDYRLRLAQSQGELNRLFRQAKQQRVSSMLAFEGWDAAGKGGSIRRILQALDPRNYQVVPTAAPTAEELAHHYLWRFWRHLPTGGDITIFDRSWYGRVLVERVEGFARPDEWQRAYKEINEFEQQLVESGIMVCKYWLHITKDEQLRRFEERQTTPHKRWKLTDEDWRNREKWDEYESAVNDMIQLTNTPQAPWVIVPANDKYTARIHVLDAVCDQLRNFLM
ncbi:thymidylate kinase [Rubripirellula obstinata]|uniref:Thymidylate kinase n=1 Tax=Rubripirellula obstinata TaxID=406547 RepID=A0A5B1C906_9BACT|nr:polyphosphate:AMP phosphotransferase [Rubripirellula obstinata]KAA1257607.1 thymidylate kinase [Rubripirellula obstinata]